MIPMSSILRCAMRRGHTATHWLRPRQIPTSIARSESTSSLASRVGKVDFYNEQTALPHLDEVALQNRARQIAKCIGYPHYDVTLLLVDDKEMTEVNLESRGIAGPTDILSFPFHECVEPGVLEPPEFDIPDYYSLGDMVIDVPYVIRCCNDDREDFERFQAGGSDSSDSGDNDGENDNDSEDEEGEEEDDDDRGVSGAMATVFDPERRLHMLLVHGMLHLVGHDHEEDDEYEVMVTEEETLLKELDLVD
eukprot:CAMPEP_0198109524 /NCGR_PEP_ID=MMETSP1442-20131203/1592_1 /TAXON_ID= /ORGANISM="Craspedostauros australis, Strain CCMP3328" /LENGTH=249 /DNA_ID=CAMNT_0043765229 /DNA_START=374 /DNA_END=1123 /DNA_ORIENTATION=+